MRQTGEDYRTILKVMKLHQRYAMKGNFMDDIKNLTEEKMEKARACKSSEELVELAKAEGVELNDEQLDAIAGGTWYNCMNETW